MKYIRHKRLGFVVFNEANIHRDMAYAIGAPGDIRSAGFCHKDRTGKMVCHGESISLGIPSAPEDSADLNESLAA